MINMIILALVCLAAAPRIASAQDHSTPTPPCIVVHPDGEYEIRLGTGNEPAHNEEVPVYWKAADGSLRSGKTYDGSSSDGLGGHSARIPLYLVRRTDGAWVVEEGMWVVCHGPTGHWRTDIPGSSRVRVRDLSAPTTPRPDPAQALKARGGVNISYMYDDTGEPSHFDIVDQLMVARAIWRAVGTINELLGHDYVPALVQFV